jgi:hypothetical protein
VLMDATLGVVVVIWMFMAVITILLFNSMKK